MRNDEYFKNGNEYKYWKIKHYVPVQKMGEHGLYEFYKIYVTDKNEENTHCVLITKTLLQNFLYSIVNEDEEVKDEF